MNRSCNFVVEKVIEPLSLQQAHHFVQNNMLADSSVVTSLPTDTLSLLQRFAASTAEEGQETDD